MKKEKKKRKEISKPPFFYPLLYVLSFFLLFFLLFPILWLIFSTNPSSVFESLKNPIVINAILTTLVSATITTLLSLVLGVALGYVLARKKSRTSRIISIIVDLPMALPHSVAGIALLALFGRAGLIGQLFPTEYGSIFTRTLLGVVIAQMFVSTPIIIQGAKETFELIDPRLETYSEILGASPFKTFTSVSLPLSSSSIFASSLLCWARASSEFGAVVFMAYYPLSAPVIIFDFFNSQGAQAALPVAVIIVIFSTVVFTIVKIFSSRTQKRGNNA
ncbi:MAG: ABC transporter permease subunit [Candidatus Heimdallarchaeaceae archaeon]